VKVQEKSLVCVSALDCLIGWRLFYLSFAQAGREGEKEGDLRVAVMGELQQPLDYHPAHQGSGLLSASHAE
jgi:hypothetical protein